MKQKKHIDGENNMRLRHEIVRGLERLLLRVNNLSGMKRGCLPMLESPLMHRGDSCR
jgi:hypothetical protein